MHINDTDLHHQDYQPSSSLQVGSFVVGLAGGFPGVLAPGIGLSAYFSYSLVIQGAKLDKEVSALSAANLQPLPSHVDNLSTLWSLEGTQSLSSSCKLLMKPPKSP